MVVLPTPPVPTQTTTRREVTKSSGVGPAATSGGRRGCPAQHGVCEAGELLGSLNALAYAWRIIEGAYFDKAPEGAAVVKEAPLSMLLPIWVMAGATIYFGIDATGTLDIASGAAEALMSGVIQ